MVTVTSFVPYFNVCDFFFYVFAKCVQWHEMCALYAEMTFIVLDKYLVLLDAVCYAMAIAEQEHKEFFHSSLCARQIPQPLAFLVHIAECIFKINHSTSGYFFHSFYDEHV